MGEFRVEPITTSAQRRQCTEEILRDLEALERMVHEKYFAAEEMHCGVEQEMFLVTESGAPAAIGTEVLAAVEDRRLVSELALFNVEANLDPLPLGGDFLERLQRDLESAVENADGAARRVGARTLLVGSLPSLEARHLTRAYITPEPRYAALDSALLQERGSDLQLIVRGWDRYEAVHDTVMPEAANTSLQLHQQVRPEHFTRLYNWAQLISAPLLAVATNSPFFCGRRLWHESRVAIFEASTDARTAGERERGVIPRVSLGKDWLRGDVVDLYRQQVTRYRPLLSAAEVEDPFRALDEGRIPRLQALMLHNGTVWRWNRACYGVGERPHLRIENRILPAGPTVLDEVANAAFFYGMMNAANDSIDALHECLPFSSVQRNFLQCAREGIGAKVAWIGDADGQLDVRELIQDELLPLAQRGLFALGVAEATIERLLGVVRERAESGVTASVWQLRSATNLQQKGLDVPVQLTRALLRAQSSGRPLHEIPFASARIECREEAPLLRDIMTRDVFTVRADDALRLAEAMMRWQHIRHVPVLDDTDEVVGLITARALLAAARSEEGGPRAVSEVMEAAPPVLEPETPLEVAIERMAELRVGCVVVGSRPGRVEGIVTERDFLRPLLHALRSANELPDQLGPQGSGLASADQVISSR